MHPAKSVIFFTTATGAGYGLAFWAAWFITSGAMQYNLSALLLIFVLSLGLITAGLMSSTLHLGRPERAWRALSQWRSSWLSREGVAAIAAYCPILALAYFWYIGANSGIILATALLTMIIVMITVICTAMIYASLKPIPSWHNPAVIIGYPLYSLATGATLLWCLSIEGSIYILPQVPVIFLIASLMCKLWHWRITDKPIASSMETATGLAQPETGKKVISFELPHDSPNYLMKEMGYDIARQHVATIKVLVILCAFLIPATIILLFPTANIISALIVFIVCGGGIFAERWLFFAQAFHLVGLYYGKKPD